MVGIRVPPKEKQDYQMKVFTLRVVLLAALGMLTLSGCADNSFLNSGASDPGANVNSCGTNRVQYCQEDPLKPRSRVH